MTRILAFSFCALAGLAAGCNTNAATDATSATGGAGGSRSSGGSPGGSAAGSGGSAATGTGGVSTPAASGGSSGSGGGPSDSGGSGAPAGGGASGSGGGSGSGGSGGDSGGSSGSGDAQPDAPGDAPIVSSDGGGIPGHEWVIPCQGGWSREQCCMHYCTCMMQNCAAKAPGNCLTTCTAPGNDWNLKCRVEQCFESLDPRFPMDKGSHCGHAIEKAHCQGIIP